jgi:hypothetical protein
MILGWRARCLLPGADQAAQPQPLDQQEKAG